MAVFLIADTHFGHANIIKYENRPFKDVADMNEGIIKNWNQTVKKDDKVFILGDVGFGNKEMITNIVAKLNGKKHLVMGNHDKDRTARWWREAGFDEVSEFPIIYKDFYIFSHEPLYINSNMPYANIFGHVHSSPAYETVTNQTYCVSIERINYRPIEFEVVKKAIEEAEEKKSVVDLWETLRENRAVQSRAEFRRLIVQGAIKVNGITKTEMFSEECKNGDIITIGKNRTITVGGRHIERYKENRPYNNKIN